MRTLIRLSETRIVELLSRLGYVVHGLLFMVIGILAARLNWGDRGKIANPPDALALIQREPIGWIIIPLMAIGLACYAGWRFLQAATDPDHQGRTIKGLIVRTARCVSGLGYTALAIFAGRLALGLVHSSSQSNKPGVTQALLWPSGRLLGALVSMILLVAAGDDIRKALTTNFGERFHPRRLPPVGLVAAKGAGVWGFAGRSLIMLAASFYLLRAAFDADPHAVRGFEGVLTSMAHLPYGHWLLGFVSFGLFFYGMFMAQAGVFRRHPF